jgi:RecA-family ATPase
MTDLLSQALELAEEYPVFPCNDKKQPVCKGGFYAATQDADEITQLFSIPQATLIGVPTGSPSGISVVDIDVNDGKAGAEWLNTNKERLGVTKIVQTQSGGWHYYYKHEDGITNKAGISRCIDIRGTGGYIIAPPSRGYKYLNDEELAEFPDFLKGKNIPEVFTPNQQSQLTDAFGSITDGREKYMSALVFATVLEYIRENNEVPSEEWMVSNVYPTYALKVKSRCNDLEKEDRGVTAFLKKVRSTVQKQIRQGALERGEFDDPLPEVKMPEYEESEDVPEKRRYQSFLLPELQQLPPPKFLVAPYLLENSFACLFGAPASYKSFLALDWALSICHGVDWNGRATEKGAVVYLAMEGQAGLIQRTEAWHRDTGLDPSDTQFVCFIQPLSFADEDSGDGDVTGVINEIKRRLGGVPPKMIVVDTLARSFTGKDENNATDMGIFVRNMDTFKHEFDCTVLAVHHSGKDSDRGMRGSSALRGAVDTELEIKRKSDTMNVCLRTRKQKDTEEAEPLWMEAREVNWLENKFGIERSSLVLDPSDEPKKAEPKLSNDQKIALDILDTMLQNEAILEQCHQGYYGVPYNYWRENVCNSLPKLDDRRRWGDFKKRLIDRKFISLINNLVNKK